VTILSYSSTHPGQLELQGVYGRLEGRAAWLMGGWENVMGSTPDDIAQVGLNNYLTVLPVHGDESAAKIASYRLQQDVRDLYQKQDHNKTEYFPDPDDDETDEDEYPDHPISQIESTDRQTRYFGADLVDQMASMLTKREMEAVILVFEDDLTHESAAKAMHVRRLTVTTYLRSAIKKLREQGLYNG